MEASPVSDDVITPAETDYRESDVVSCCTRTSRNRHVALQREMIRPELEIDPVKSRRNPRHSGG